ncbi:hypothetical protein AFE_0410 [Acidithiobacillus ferrooxidans ATCC 23270]|uniref:Uncharacterized protein n=1 Tax=Acidithiobacillus ferrooxidans (strain ATCC 23270 / DSM 14882 / CIP 104768 / NCIMB 8455) TaxID=243159 RepID=B7J4F3_ACIF2|nr:hypothetical protein AFE_0410 [Acidithiobacillus ferrooxidans ATCC 23270]
MCGNRCRNVLIYRDIILSGVLPADLPGTTTRFTKQRRADGDMRIGGCDAHPG